MFMIFVFKEFLFLGDWCIDNELICSVVNIIIDVICCVMGSLGSNKFFLYVEGFKES